MDDFVIQYASWHNSFHLKYNKSIRVNKTDVSEKRLSRKHQATEVYTAVCSVKRGRKKVSCIRFSAFDIDSNMQTVITELQDIYLFAWIDGADLIAIEAKYYLKCLTATSVWKIVMEEFFAHEMQFSDLLSQTWEVPFA